MLTLTTSTTQAHGKNILQAFTFGPTRESSMGQPGWNNNRSGSAPKPVKPASAAERALRVKLICQAVKAGTYRISTGDLADRFLERIAAGQLRAAG